MVEARGFMNVQPTIREVLERTSKTLADAWCEAVEALLEDTPGISPVTHTLVTMNTDNGGMMAWVCPNDAVSGTPRFPRIVLECSELQVTIRRETVSPRKRSTSAPTKETT